MPDATLAISPSLPRAERTRRILDRDGHDCVWCRRSLWPGHPHLSLEHVVPRLKGGTAWPENEVCACSSCNRRPGHVSPVDWLADCEERAMKPNRAAIQASLERLEAAIAAGADSGERVPTWPVSCAGSHGPDRARARRSDATGRG